MQTFTDTEFGEIVVHKRRGTRKVSIKMGTDGRFVATVPPYTPLLYIKGVIRTAREELRTIAKNTTPSIAYADGQPVGKHHSIAVVHTGMVTTATVKIERKKLLVYLPSGTRIDSGEVQQLIREKVIIILRREAKDVLPGLLAALAHAHGFRYSNIRFSHAAGRWGSCSSTGTISLNIALMKLPDPLIEYVLIHELCHTRHMNHSPAFWQEVERYDPHFRLHRRQIKRETPSV